MRKLLMLLTAAMFTQFSFAGTGTEKKGNEPVLAGTVTDASSKKPLAEVNITAIHSITKTEHTITTDIHGNFKVPQLPVGTYKLKFDKENYKPLEKKDVNIKADATAKLNIELVNYKDEEPEDSRNWSFKIGL